MIIGIDATRANKPQKTGVEWYSYHLIRALSKESSKHIFRLYFRSDPEPSLAKLGENVQYKILSWPFKYLWTQVRLSFEVLINPPDCLFIPAQIIPMIHPSKTITTIHDVAYKPFPTSYSAGSRFYLNLAALLASRLPAIITVSEFSKSEIRKYYNISDKKIHVIPLGLEHADRDPSPMVLTKHAITKPYLLSVGRLERKKNIKLLIKSFNLIKVEPWGKEFQLVLVGIKGHGWGEIERDINVSPFREDIKIVGWVTEPEKHSLFAQAVAFILISAYEGFGLPLLEAMDAGTPIITTDQASLPEVAGEAAITVPRGKINAVRDALQDIVYNKIMRNDLIDKGKLRAKQYTWQRTAKETLAVFDRIH
jgi:glycosyltransferase involved in cell wall biosynthesis